MVVAAVMAALAAAVAAVAEVQQCNAGGRGSGACLTVAQFLMGGHTLEIAHRPSCSLGLDLGRY